MTGPGSACAPSTCRSGSCSTRPTRGAAAASAARPATATRVWSKLDAQVVCVDPALRDPNVTLLTDAHVTKLETGASGREVTRLVVKRGDATETYSADVVVVSAGAINSAALLLRSASDRHPRGIANGSDVVGRHYMGHVNSILLALSK